MGYTLMAGISTGRIDSDLGTFEIEDGRVEVDDYETATALVDRYAVEWPNGDPGAPEDEDGGDAEAEPAAADDDLEYEERRAQAESLATEHWQSVVSTVESGEADDYLEALERVDDRDSVQDAIDERRDELEE